MTNYSIPFQIRKRTNLPKIYYLKFHDFLIIVITVVLNETYICHASA